MVEHGEVDSEGDEEAGGEKFGAGETVEICHDGESDHGGGDGDADRARELATMHVINARDNIMNGDKE